MLNIFKKINNYLKSLLNKPFRFNLTFLVFILILYKIKNNINLSHNYNSVILILISFILYYIFAKSWISISNILISEIDIKIFDIIKNKFYHNLELNELHLSFLYNLIIELLFIIILILLSLWLVAYSKYIKNEFDYKIFKNTKTNSILRLIYILLSLLLLILLYYFNDDYFNINNFKYLNKLLIILLILFIFSENIIIKLFLQIFKFMLSIIFIFL